MSEVISEPEKRRKKQNTEVERSPHQIPPFKPCVNPILEVVLSSYASYLMPKDLFCFYQYVCLRKKISLLPCREPLAICQLHDVELSFSLIFQGEGIK